MKPNTKGIGTMSPKKEEDRSQVAQSAIYWGLTDRHMSGAAGRQVDSRMLMQKEGIYMLSYIKVG
jgi:hypothetical protein